MCMHVHVHIYTNVCNARRSSYTQYTIVQLGNENQLCFACKSSYTYIYMYSIHVQCTCTGLYTCTCMYFLFVYCNRDHNVGLQYTVCVCVCVPFGAEQKGSFVHYIWAILKPLMEMIVQPFLQVARVLALRRRGLVERRLTETGAGERGRKFQGRTRWTRWHIER